MRNKFFGLKIKKLRLSKHLTQTQLANELGVTLRTIQNWEIDNKIPRYKETLVKAANYLGVSTEYLLDDTKDIPDYIILPQKVHQAILDTHRILADSKISQDNKDYMMLEIFKCYITKRKP